MLGTREPRQVCGEVSAYGTGEERGRAGMFDAGAEAEDRGAEGGAPVSKPKEMITFKAAYARIRACRWALKRLTHRWTRPPQTAGYEVYAYVGSNQSRGPIVRFPLTASQDASTALLAAVKYVEGQCDQVNRETEAWQEGYGYGKAEVTAQKEQHAK